jgi:hypothetical protein
MATSSFFRGAAATAVLAAVATAVMTLGGGVAATTGLASCLSADSYVYSAQLYDPTADCVHVSKAVEVVNGSGASANCPAVCLTVGEDLYVSTLCPPLPTIASAVDRDAGPCIAALAALASGGTCETPIVAEGGADADAADDAGDEDADTDAEAPDAEGVDAADAATIKDAADAG